MDGALGSILLGLLGGTVAWSMTQLLFVPRLRWSTYVSRRNDDAQPCGYLYRVKLKNGSWFRSVVDLRIQGRVRFRHPYEHGGSVAKSIRLGTRPGDVHPVRPREHILVSLYLDEVEEHTVEALRGWGYDLRSGAWVSSLFWVSATVAGESLSWLRVPTVSPGWLVLGPVSTN